MKEQRKGRKIALTPDELDTYLAEARTCRVATNSVGAPHVSPLWFVWVDGVLWLNSIVKSQRWTDIERDPRVGIVVDDGVEFTELRGVEIQGTAEVVGDVPRSAEPDPAVAAAELAFARKYTGGDTFTPDGRHAWLKVTPDKIASWDFRKIFS